MKGGEHGKEPGKAHGGEKGHQGHRDYHGSYSFTCAAPAKLAEVSLAYFEAFPNAGRLTIQLIGPKGQTQIVATRASATVGLSGVN